MEAFGLGPLPYGWECKIEPKTGRIYFINHTAKSTTWEDPRLSSIPTPPYHIAITQPSAYFEDAGGSRWSSPVPSLRGFSLHRRGSSPRLGGSPRIAPSPTPPPRNKRNEQSIILASSSSSAARGEVTSPLPLAEPLNSTVSHRTTPSQLLTAHHPGTSTTSDGGPPMERPASARSFSSSSYCGVPSSFLASCDAETAYRTICCLFPTAGEPQIRHLFHKYHNRANLVLSALQVAKHPLASEVASQLELSQKHLLEGRDGDTDTIITSIPGDTKSIGMHSPFKMNSCYGMDSPARTGTPVSLLKFSNNPSSLGSSSMTRWGSPQLSMSPQLNLVKLEVTKPPKSPKMKLKYLKGIFPAADETFLLDVLASCENNVQKASDKLQRKGFSRTPPPKPARQKWFEIKSLIEKRQRAINQQALVNSYHQAMGEPLESPFPTPLLRSARPHPTAEQKENNRKHLVGKFPQLPERFISWALEAANFEEDKAERLLQEVGPQTPDEFKPFVTGEKTTKDGEISEGKKISFADTVVEVMEGNNNITHLNDEMPFMFSDDIINTPDSGYFEIETKPRKKSFIANLLNMKSADRDTSYIVNSAFAKGPDSSLAKGRNPDLLKSNYLQTIGGTSLRKGPNLQFRQGPKSCAKGPNPTLVKGSLWAKAKSATIPSSNNRGNLHVSVEG